MPISAPLVKVATARPTVRAISSGSRFSRILPDTTRSTSSRSLIRWVTWVTWRAMMSCARLKDAPPPCVSSSTRTALPMAASGVRSSWESIARKSSFVRLSRSARSRVVLAWSSSVRSFTIRFSRLPWLETVVVSERLTSKVPESEPVNRLRHRPWPDATSVWKSSRSSTLTNRFMRLPTTDASDSPTSAAKRALAYRMSPRSVSTTAPSCICSTRCR